MKKNGNKKNNGNRKKNLLEILLIAGITIIVMGVFTWGLSRNAGAFGDYNDYDYDSGGSDWGSDWGDSDWGDSDWGSSSSSYDGDSGDGIFSLLWLIFSFVPARFRCCCIVLVIIAVVLVTTIKRISRRKNVQNSVQNQTKNQGQIPPRQPAAPRRQAPLTPLNIPNRDGEIGRIIAERDPNFTIPDFITFSKNVYMNIQDAWCKRDLEPVRPVLHQNLYERTEKQVQKKIADGIVQHLDRLTVNDAYTTSYRQDAQFEYIKVYLNSSMIDYQVKESTGQILYGDQSTRWTMRYEMTFMRSLSAKTPEAGSKEIGMNCPNCGAPLTGTSFGKCPYCDSLVTTGLYNWVLSDFNAIKDHFNDEGIQVNRPDNPNNQ